MLKAQSNTASWTNSIRLQLHFRCRLQIIQFKTALCGRGCDQEPSRSSFSHMQSNRLHQGDKKNGARHSRCFLLFLTPIGPSATPIGAGEWLFHTLCYFSISRETLNTFVIPFLSCRISTLFPVLSTRRIFLTSSASSAATLTGAFSFPLWESALSNI